MKKYFLFLLPCFLFSVISAQTKDLSKDDLKTNKEKYSYVLGHFNGKKHSATKVDVDLKLFYKGLKAANEGKEAPVSKEIMEQIVNTYRKEAYLATIEKYKEESEKFLEENSKKPGVITTESGLQYKVIKEGTGKSPVETDEVKVNYRGTLIDGTEFSSSYKKGKPSEFSLLNVMRGWTEGLQLMKEGAVYEFYIPSELAYGTRPKSGSKIRPNDAVIFEVELLEVKTK